MTDKLVRVGQGLACINQITTDHIRYTCEAGQSYTIDLADCTRRWGQLFERSRHNIVLVPGATETSVADWNAGCVGARDALSDPPYVIFPTEPPVRFEFPDYDTLYLVLLNPLRLVGKYTFDMA